MTSASRTILGIVHVHTRKGLSGMDAITVFASWPNSIDEMIRAVAEPDSPPTLLEICDVARAIGDGDVRIIVNGDRANLGRTQRVIVECLRTAMVRNKEDGGPAIPMKAVSYWINALLGAGCLLLALVLLVVMYG
jgi:hypothetical protein